MFTINDLLEQVDCQGKVRVMLIEEGSGDLRQVFNGNHLNEIPYKYGCKELAYIWSDGDTTVYEINE